MENINLGNNQEKNKINYNDPEPNDLIRFLESLEKYENEDGELEEIPNLYNEGKLDKELLAGILMYKAPQYMLVGHESAQEILNFLNKLNIKLKNQTLSETINYLESQIPYLNEANNISKRAFDDFEKMQNDIKKNGWFKNIEENTEILTTANQANLLRTKVEVLYTNMVNRVYDKLWEEYLMSENPPEPKEPKQIS